VLELGASGQDIDRENVEADGNTVAMAFGKLPKVGGRHAAQDFLLVGVDLGLCRSHVTGSAGLDFEENEGVAVPGGKIEIATESFRAPAAGDDGVAESAQMEKSGVFTLFAGEEVRGLAGFAVREALERGVGAAFETQRKVGEGHASSIHSSGAKAPFLCLNSGAKRRLFPPGKGKFRWKTGHSRAAIYLDVHTKHNQKEQLKRSMLCQQSTSL